MCAGYWCFHQLYAMTGKWEAYHWSKHSLIYEILALLLSLSFSSPSLSPRWLGGALRKVIVGSPCLVWVFWSSHSFQPQTSSWGLALLWQRESSTYQGIHIHMYKSIVPGVHYKNFNVLLIIHIAHNYYTGTWLYILSSRLAPLSTLI